MGDHPCASNGGITVDCQNVDGDGVVGVELNLFGHALLFDKNTPAYSKRPRHVARLRNFDQPEPHLSAGGPQRQSLANAGPLSRQRSRLPFQVSNILVQYEASREPKAWSVC
jgi:hypothetical protein